MSDAPSSVMSARHHPTLVDRAAFWSSWLLAGAVFLTIGWLAMAPDDPRGAVSILTRGGGWMMLLQAAGLAAVTAALTTVIAGRRLPYVGAFAAAVGLASVSLRGWTTAYFLLQGAETPEVSQPALAGQFALEAMAWFVVMLIAVVISAVVTRWCFFSPPGVGSGEEAPSGSIRDGLEHLLIVFGAGMVVFYTLSSQMAARSIQHGQSCFVVAATICMASYLAARIVPAPSVHWPIFAVGLLAGAGYGWAALHRVSGLPAGVPANPFLRVLPIQFVSVGIAAAVAMFWYSRPLAYDDAGGEINPSDRPTSTDEP